MYVTNCVAFLTEHTIFFLTFNNFFFQKDLKIAKYLESVQTPGLAGQYYKRCGKYVQALELLMKAGGQYIEDAIHVIKLAQDVPKRESMITMVQQYLSETNSNPSNDQPNHQRYAFELCLAIGEFEEACKMAISASQQEARTGSYKQAHRILFMYHQSLQDYISQKTQRSNNKEFQNEEKSISVLSKNDEKGKTEHKIPAELKKLLLLYHSYLLVKKFISVHNNHKKAACLLLRVAQNISKFPAHVVPILTSVVVECQRAQMVHSAYEYAQVLMTKEYREMIHPSYQKTIETIIRFVSICKKQQKFQQYKSKRCFVVEIHRLGTKKKAKNIHHVLIAIMMSRCIGWIVYRVRVKSHIVLSQESI
ncbi:WD-repeat protein [Reticulomyxa filosa]|uniref:WD-repeat protein n=1 Tax=Reticulomyxa filosa TaxID=46433 RepID=X6P6V0_RETFI|nr:WD-repeat protein [Reticulomyxa filosa]|eukprot:ETO34270.1 WD-repeat protein [Reticulomyxa filosa]